MSSQEKKKLEIWIIWHNMNVRDRSKKKKKLVIKCPIYLIMLWNDDSQLYNFSQLLAAVLTLKSNTQLIATKFLVSREKFHNNSPWESVTHDRVWGLVSSYTYMWCDVRRDSFCHWITRYSRYYIWWKEEKKKVRRDLENWFQGRRSLKSRLILGQLTIFHC
jgi:hypothetical protein